MNRKFLAKLKISAVAKFGGPLVLATVALAFITHPVGESFAASSSNTAQFNGVFQSCGEQISSAVDKKDTVPYMIAPFLDHNAHAQDLQVGSFINATYKGQPANGLYKGNGQAILIVAGKPVIVTIANVATNSRKK